MLKRAERFYFRIEPIEPVEVDSEMVGSWLDAADRRDMAVAFEQIDKLLMELRSSAPLRAWRLRRDIAWLVRQADKRGLRW